MLRYGDIERARYRLQNLANPLRTVDFFVTNVCVAPTRRCLVTFRVVGIKLFLVEILDVGANIGHTPRDVFRCVRGSRRDRQVRLHRQPAHQERSGEPTYQIEGDEAWRCGSFASSGFA